jgi:dihydroorotate dehydrogenase (NAD+) catalytic subunit
MVYECRQVVKIPILGMGGIAEARDVLEFMIAGADAVQVGTANFVDPFVWSKILLGVREYMDRHAIGRLADIVGTLRVADEESRADHQPTARRS